MKTPKKPTKQNIKLGKTIEVSELSDDTKEVIEHFGLEAPELLNQYSIALEDALVEQVRFRQQGAQENRRLRKLLEQHNISH